MVVGQLYKVTSPSGKSYVGITSLDTDRRWKKHVSTALGPDPEGRGCPALNRAIQKYGPQSFQVKALVIAEWDYLAELEPKAIAAYGTKAPNGYNLSDGGDGVPGVVLTEKTKHRMSEAAKKRRHSAETKKKIGDASRGKKRPEHAQTLTGRKRPDHSAFMKKLWAQRRGEV